MFTRIVMLMLIATLALPVAALPRSAETSHSLWGDVVVAANGKKHKKKTKPPRTKTITRTIRQSVTETFTNPERINIPFVEILVNDGPADPYPSVIAVSGFSNGTITDVNVTLEDFTHSGPSDVDVLLSTSGSRQALVLSDVGGTIRAIDVDLLLDDEAAAPLPNGQLQSGTFRPTNLTANFDTFAAPAPVLNGTVARSTFDGTDPNGTWQLWVMDNGNLYVGGLGSGWALEITAEVDVQAQEQVPVAKAKKHKKHKKRKK